MWTFAIEISWSLPLFLRIVASCIKVKDSGIGFLKTCCAGLFISPRQCRAQQQDGLRKAACYELPLTAANAAREPYMQVQLSTF